MVQNIFLRQPIFGVPGPVDMNFPQEHRVAPDENPGHPDHNYPIVEYVGPGAEVDVGINQHIEQEDPLPGGSRWRSEEDDEGDDKSNSKRFRWWDECAYSDWDSCTDSDVSSITSEDSDEDDIVGEEEEEEDPLPGGTRKRERDKKDEDDTVKEEMDPCTGVSRKRERDGEDEDERTTKKSRQ